MKKFLTGLLVLLISIPISAQQYFGTPAAEGHRCIVLMNPTVNNLKTVLYLIENRIFLLPGDYNLVGFYNKYQSYDFGESKQFIEQSGRGDLFLQECSNDPEPVIFGENACSKNFREVFAGAQGVIFFGGPDIPPALYGEQTNLLTQISDYHRHTFEVSFLFHLLGGYQDENYIPLLEQKPDFRILGICLGMQTMNVATGGTLIQDIPTEIYHQSSAEQALSANPDAQHRNYYTNLGTVPDLLWGHFHRISITDPYRIQRLIIGSEKNPYVLSSHHQAAGRIGKGLLPVATSLDGKVVEILVHDTYPNVLGVQFHPEPGLLYQPDVKIRDLPDEKAKYSFIDLYGGGKGETFNRNVWKWMGEVFK